LLREVDGSPIGAESQPLANVIVTELTKALEKAFENGELVTNVPGFCILVFK
jgi:hypothetical protein